MQSVHIPQPILPGQLVNLITPNLFTSEALRLYCWALTDIDFGTDSSHCVILQSLVVLAVLPWIRAGFHFTRVVLMLAEWNYTQRSGLINPRYKDGIKCQRAKESPELSQAAFWASALPLGFLWAASGWVEGCICPGRLSSWASPWFSCLNAVGTCRLSLSACQK